MSFMISPSGVGLLQFQVLCMTRELCCSQTPKLLLLFTELKLTMSPLEACAAGFSGLASYHQLNSDEATKC